MSNIHIQAAASEIKKAFFEGFQSYASPASAYNTEESAWEESEAKKVHDRLLNEASSEAPKSADLRPSRRKLDVGNRDGDAYVVAANGKHYLVLEADTFHNEEVFIGMGSTVQVEISEVAFAALVKTATA